MKLRIQDSSVRFRITLKELETLAQMGCLRSYALLPSADEMHSTFTYEVIRLTGEAQSQLLLRPYSITLALADSDFNELSVPTSDGAYIQREWTDDNGTLQRFIVFIEKDRPGRQPSQLL